MSERLPDSSQKLKVRPSAVILTPEGILLVKDKNDKYLQQTVERIKSDRFKSDEQKAAAITIIGSGGKYSLPGGGPEQGESPFETVIREVKEELGLVIEPHNMIPLAEIRGKKRRHLIYLVKTDGKIELQKLDGSIAGIGLLKYRNIVPLNHLFNQMHVVKLHPRFYSRVPQERELMSIQWGSHLQVEETLIYQWYVEEKLAQVYRGKKHKKKYPTPHLIESTPNLTILDHEGKPIPPKQMEFTLTRNSRAIDIPRSEREPHLPRPGIMKVRTPTQSIQRIRENLRNELANIKEEEENFDSGKKKINSGQ